MSSAAMRSTSAAGSSVISSMTMVLSAAGRFRRAARRSQEGFRGGIACSRQQCRTPVAGSQRQTPMRAHGTKHHRLRRAPHPIFTLSGRHRRDIDDSYTTVLPATIQGIRRYLGSGMIKGLPLRTPTAYHHPGDNVHLRSPHDANMRSRDCRPAAPSIDPVTACNATRQRIRAAVPADKAGRAAGAAPRFYLWKISATAVLLAAGWAAFVVAGDSWWQPAVAVLPVLPAA